MNTKGIKINSDKRLTDSQLEKAIELIAALPEDSFMSVKEGNRKGASIPTHMAIDELDISYSPGANYMRITGKKRNSKKSIGSTSLPKEASQVFASSQGPAYTFKETRYSIQLH